MNLKFSLMAMALASMTIHAQASDAGKSHLLTEADQAQLASWLAMDKEKMRFKSLWYGEKGAKSKDWYQAVKDAEQTITLYKIINHEGEPMLIGGMTTTRWSSPSGYNGDDRAFIFNLTTSEKQKISGHRYHAIHTHSDRFATFGGGYDIFPGRTVLGAMKGYSRSMTYDESQGSITVQGDGKNKASMTHTFDVIAMETLHFTPMLY